MEQNWKPIEYKFILLGDSSVGKSSIYHRLSGKSFSEETMTTIGIEKRILYFDNIEIDEKEKTTKNFKIILFDTAGQERYRAITKSYFKASQGIILIYSIVDETSFEHIQTWLDSIKDALSEWKRSGYIVMLLGNKLDIAKEHVERRMILTEEAESLCSEQGIYWGGELSAKTFDEDQIKGIFTKFVQQIYNKLGEEDLDNEKNNQVKLFISEVKKEKKKIPKIVQCCFA